MNLCKSVSHGSKHRVLQVCDIAKASRSYFAFWKDHIAVSVLLGLSSCPHQIGQLLGNHSKLSLAVDIFLIEKGQL